MNIASGRVAILFLLLVTVSATEAQSTLNQQISGQVIDASGSVLPDAVVTVTNQDTALTRSTKTNADGNYMFPDLSPGKYRITAEAPGFTKQSVDNNPLATNVSIEVNIRMQVGSQADTSIISSTTKLF